MNERETKSEALAVRTETQNIAEQKTQERTRWIEDEVEELERWDGLE